MWTVNLSGSREEQFLKKTILKYKILKRVSTREICQGLTWGQGVGLSSPAGESLPPDHGWPPYIYSGVFINSSRMPTVLATTVTMGTLCNEF